MIEIKNFKKVYPPSEDSLLLLKAVKYARGEVLDLCAGSGIIGLNAAKKASKVTLVDINPFAIRAIKYNAYANGIKNYEAIRSNLFDKIKNKRFDVIYANPPYLPKSEKKDWEEYALSGGKEGSELTIKILKEARKHLKEGGRIFLILSTVYEIDKVYKWIRRLKFSFRRLSSVNFFFEEIVLIEVYDKSRNSDK